MCWLLLWLLPGMFRIFTAVQWISPKCFLLFRVMYGLLTMSVGPWFIIIYGPHSLLLNCSGCLVHVNKLWWLDHNWFQQYIYNTREKQNNISHLVFHWHLVLVYHDFFLLVLEWCSGLQGSAMDWSWYKSKSPNIILSPNILLKLQCGYNMPSIDYLLLQWCVCVCAIYLRRGGRCPCPLETSGHQLRDTFWRKQPFRIELKHSSVSLS